MTDLLHDDSFVNALAFLTERYPTLVSSHAGWPKFDHFQTAFKINDKEHILLNDAVRDGNFLKLVHQIAECIYALNVMSVVLGVDIRAILATVHRRHMADEDGEIDEDALETVISLQDPLPQPMREASE